MADLRKFRELARNWDALGETDPLFGVLSDPSKYGGRWDAEEFFASGRAHVDKLRRMLADARAACEPGACLDFGAGVGRLTVPLAAGFRHTVGVDVSPAMVAAARRHAPASARCTFVVNHHPDLRAFDTASFDLVHSCLVLQHIPPDIALRYIGEFFRVARPGGLVVFQVPAAVFTEAQLSASHALPASACLAELAIAEPPGTLDVAAFAPLVVRVTNRGEAPWRHDIPAGRHICVGNHWLDADGHRIVDDDARGRLSRPVAPGDTVEVPLRVQAPGIPGTYVLECDLVQEHVCWFADRGSPTLRLPVTVAGAAPGGPAAVPVPPEPIAAPPVPAPRVPIWTRMLRRWRGGTPTFEMHVVPRAEVERVVRENGGDVLRAVDDNAAGAGWLSYTYICRRL